VEQLLRERAADILAFAADPDAGVLAVG